MSASETVYVVMMDDRHIDPTAALFSNRESAIAWARNAARANTRSPDDLDETLTEAQRREGWLYYACYSGEGDCVWVYPSTVLS